MTRNNLESKVLSKEEKLKAELAEIEKNKIINREAFTKKLESLPEMKELVALCTFNDKYKFKVEMTVECDFHIIPFSDESNGYVYVGVADPKKTLVTPFLGDDSLVDACMDNIGDIGKIRPEIAAQIKKKSEVEQKVLKIARNLAKQEKIDIKIEELERIISDIVLDELS